MNTPVDIYTGGAYRRIYIMKTRNDLEAEAIDILSAQAPHELEIFNRWNECIDFYIAGYNSAIDTDNKTSSEK